MGNLHIWYRSDLFDLEDPDGRDIQTGQANRIG
jgi:hypothetical protein